MTKRKLRKQIEELKTENATLKVCLRAYMQSNEKLQDDVDLLNASLDAAIADRERWMDIAHKADERRRNYVRHMVSADSGDLREGERMV